MANCINCGVQIPDNYKFCNKCRNELTQNPYEAPPPAQNDAVISMLLPIGRSPLAIIAGYMGLFSLLPFVGIVSIIIGVIAIIRLKKHPEKLGRGRAWFGIIMGVITTLFWLLIPIEFK